MNIGEVRRELYVEPEQVPTEVPDGEVARVVCGRLSMETGRSSYPVEVEDLDALRTELIQVAAVCVRWVGAIKR
jgi:hypothetical protein